MFRVFNLLHPVDLPMATPSSEDISGMAKAMAGVASELLAASGNVRQDGELHERTDQGKVKKTRIHSRQW